MPYVTRTIVEAPVALYDVIHAHVLDTTKGAVHGLLVHLARPTSTGFEVFEVWESRESCDSFAREVLGPMFAGAGADVGAVDTAPELHVEEFTPSGLVIPPAGVAV